MKVEDIVKICSEMTNSSNITVLNGDCDGKQPKEIWSIITNAPKEEGLIIVGDAKKGDSINVDTYDAIIKFAEDSNYSRIRHKKFDNGFYAVIIVP